MKNLVPAIVLLAVCAAAAFAQEGPVPKGIPHLDHVFVIVMENHGFNEVIGNPNAKFINQYARSANLATNYYAVGHPSLTNYLEIVGGSNFGVRSDNPPDWHSSCASNLETGIPNTDTPASPPICPIAGVGKDAATPVLDCTNEVTGPPCEIDVNGKVGYRADADTLGISIADQLVAAGKTWKSYQENLPMIGPNKVNYSDGNFSNLTDFSKIKPVLNPPLSSADIVQLYAAKHDPFVYFKDIQQGNDALNSFANIVPYDSANGLWWDLGSAELPNYSFIVPNQCNDMHGRGNSTAFCLYDPVSNGTQAGLNPALTILGDQEVEKLVKGIHASSVWTRGRNAIVVVWDENDYSVQPITNRVVTIVDTNYGVHGIRSSEFYTHFSLLRSIEGGLGLPCLNHACDAGTNTMTDMFAEN